MSSISTEGPTPSTVFCATSKSASALRWATPISIPTIANQAGDPVGSRLTLTFADHVPELTPAQVKALLAPLISFDVKTPIQAFTDTLPPALKDAILSHKVLVGMTTDMVLYAKGQPLTKSREMDGQMPIEEWIYGTPPEEVDFVRINGNRVIRVEVAKDGEPMQIFTKDVVSGMMTHQWLAGVDGAIEHAHRPGGRRATRPRQAGAGRSSQPP